MRSPTRKEVLQLALYFGPLILLIGYSWGKDAARSLNLGNCQPAGPIAKLYRAYDPLSFWIDQHERLEAELKYSDWKGMMKYCEREYIAEPVTEASCKNKFANKYESALKCYERSIEHCRAEGGKC